MMRQSHGSRTFNLRSRYSSRTEEKHRCRHEHQYPLEERLLRLLCRDLFSADPISPLRFGVLSPIFGDHSWPIGLRAEECQRVEAFELDRIQQLTKTLPSLFLPPR